MKTAVFVSKNLIGDALYISPAWNVWYQQNKLRFDRIVLVTLPDHVARLYKGMGIPGVDVVTEWDREHAVADFVHEFNVSEAFSVSAINRCHVAESYAKLLQVELEKKPDLSHLRPIYHPPAIELESWEKGQILVSMFSASCTSRDKNRPGMLPNKMLPWPKWKAVWRWIEQHFPEVPIALLGAPTDEIPQPDFQELLKIHPKTFYMKGVPLDRLAWIMRESLFTITVDNGMSHLAASQQAREFVLYPVALTTTYILPWGNQERMGYLHMDPNTVSPALVLWKLEETRKQKWGI